MTTAMTQTTAPGRTLSFISEKEPDVCRFFRAQSADLRLMEGDEREAAQADFQGVSLMAEGEALGHGIYIDGKTLESAELAIGGSPLKSFLTHGNWEADPTKTVGLFYRTERDGAKLRADFGFLKAFREHSGDKYDTLVELATTAPNALGVSLSTYGRAVWVFKDGSEEDTFFDWHRGEWERPRSSGQLERDIPSWRINAVRSADFVDIPAANPDGLFSRIKKPDTNHFSNQQPQPSKKMDVSEHVKSISAAFAGSDFKTTAIDLALEQAEAPAIIKAFREHADKQLAKANAKIEEIAAENAQFKADADAAKKALTDAGIDATDTAATVAAFQALKDRIEELQAQQRGLFSGAGVKGGKLSENFKIYDPTAQ